MYSNAPEATLRSVDLLEVFASLALQQAGTKAPQPLNLQLSDDANEDTNMSNEDTKQDAVIEKENCFQAQKCPIWPDAGSLPGSRIFFARIALLDRMFLTRPINFSGVIQFVTCWGPPVLSLEVKKSYSRKNTSVYSSKASTCSTSASLQTSAGLSAFSAFSVFVVMTLVGLNSHIVSVVRILFSKPMES